MGITVLVISVIVSIVINVALDSDGSEKGGYSRAAGTVREDNIQGDVRFNVKSLPVSNYE